MPTNHLRSASGASRDAAAPPTGEELRALDADAVRTSLEVVARVTPADLDRATPCAGWTLRDLLVHMTAQHYGFAAAARGESGLEPWRTRTGEHDPVSAYRCSAERVLAAFAEAGVLDGHFRLPEIDAERPFRAARAIGFHLVDYVVHSWDVARSLDATVDFGPRLLDAALAVARAVPDGPSRTAPGAAFAPRIPHAHGTPLEEILTLLGRSPAWPE